MFMKSLNYLQILIRKQSEIEVLNCFSFKHYNFLDFLMLTYILTRLSHVQPPFLLFLDLFSSTCPNLYTYNSQIYDLINLGLQTNLYDLYRSGFPFRKQASLPFSDSRYFYSIILRNFLRTYFAISLLYLLDIANLKLLLCFVQLTDVETQLLPHRKHR